MATIVSKRMLVLTSIEDNNNKFWEAVLMDDDTVVCNWGRVGTTGQTKTFPGAGQKYIDSKIREKEKKGYKEMQTVSSSANKNVAVAVQSGQLKSVAKKQIKYNNPTVEKLIEYLVQVNRHDIVTQSGGKLSVDVQTGLIKTDVGVAVTLDTLDRARDHLVAISKCIKQADQSSKDFITNLNEYLMCVPQKVGSRRGWEKAFIRTDDDVQKQGALIDSMESTLKALSSTPNVDGSPKEEEKVFDVNLIKSDDTKMITSISQMFNETMDRSHASATYKVRDVYDVTIGTVKQQFETNGKSLGNTKLLWHGTSAANLLSILKGGLVVPPANAAHCTGRMWGNGVYFANSSTKSLNYSMGYWGQSATARVFMLLCEVALGKPHTPRSGESHGYKIPKGYDSTWATRKDSGLRHDEFIVPYTYQCDIKNLLELAQ